MHIDTSTTKSLANKTLNQLVYMLFSKQDHDNS